MNERPPPRTQRSLQLVSIDTIPVLGILGRAIGQMWVSMRHSDKFSKKALLLASILALSAGATLAQTGGAEDDAPATAEAEVRQIAEMTDAEMREQAEAIGAHATGRLDDGGLRLIEDGACPGAGSCGGQFTANTMACVSEAIGLALPFSASTPAPYESRDAFCERAGHAVMELIKESLVEIVQTENFGPIHVKARSE